MPPLDYKKLSKGKVTRYFPSPETPNNPTQEAMLEACRELPIHEATARSASVVIATREYGEMPVDALVVGNTVLVDLGQVVRALRIGIGDEGQDTIGFGSASSESIRLIPHTKWAVIGSKATLVDNKAYEYVGGKKVMLQQPMYWTSKRHIIITLHDLLTLFREGDAMHVSDKHTILSAMVSYD